MRNPQRSQRTTLAKASSPIIGLLALVAGLLPTVCAAAAPAVPTLTSPANGATLAAGTTSVNLVWGAVSGAATYNLAVGTSCGSTSVAGWNQVAASSLVPGLSNGTTLYWRVQSVGSGGTSAFSACRTFSVQSPPAPAVPNLSSPADGASLAAGTTSVNLVWGAVNGAATYNLQVGTSCGSTSVAGWNQAAASSLVPGLSNGTTLYWRVQSVGSGGPSAFSACRTFSVQSPPATPAVPTLSSPADGASLAAGTTSVNLVWGAVNGAATYNLQVGTSCGSTSVAGWNQAAASSLVPGLSNGTTLYWRVQSVGSGGPSAFSACRIFTVGVNLAPTSGTLTPAAPSCLILAGASSCDVNLTWSTINPVGTSALTSSLPSANTIVANGDAGGPLAVSVPYPNRNFFLINNQKTLATSSATAICAPGTTWNGSTCKTPGNRIDAVEARFGGSVFLKRLGDDATPIDPNVTTWIVIHGRDGSSDPITKEGTINAIYSLAQAVALARGHQVLLLDWRDAAKALKLLDFSGQEYIGPVGKWAADTLTQLGFRGKNLNLIAHSWGSYVANELAKGMLLDSSPGSPHMVNGIVALDPAANVPGIITWLNDGSQYNTDSVDFASVSNCSWGFYSSNFGNEKTTTTALEATTVKHRNALQPDDLRDHNLPLLLFPTMIKAPIQSVPERFQLGERFQLDRLLHCDAGPWLPNRLTSTGARSQAGKYEALIEASDDGSQPVAIDFDALNNVALASNGGTAMASPPLFGVVPVPPVGAIDGDRVADGWSDGTPGQWPDWLQVTFAGSKTISEVDVFSAQDFPQPRHLPTPTMTFGTSMSLSSGLTDFQVQYLSGTQWLDIPGGNISGNNRVWRQITFSPLTTTAIRVYITKAIGSFSPLVEVEAYTAATGPLSDLTVSNLSNPPASVTVGASFTVTDTTANQGIGSAGASTTRYRLSLDSTITAADSLLTGTRSVQSLAAGETSFGSVTVTVPPGTMPGIYYLGACADDLRAVTEADETNNCRASAATVIVASPLPAPTPDLLVTALTAPTSGTVGGSLTGISVTIKNQGTGPTGAFRVGFYVATSPAYTTSAVMSGSYCAASSGLAAGSTWTCAGAISIPASLSPGGYYLIAYADDQGQVTESNETNNWLAATSGVITMTGATGQPDLLVTALTAPTSGTVGGSLAGISVTIKNQGTATTGAFRVGFYLATSPAYTASAVMSGSYCAASSGLAAGATWTCAGAISIPASLSPGGYYLIAYADDQSQVTESNETNNCLAATTGATTLTAATGQPDLLVTALTAPTNGTVGGSLAGLSVTIKNQGTAATGAFRVGFYFATSTTYSASAVMSNSYCAASGVAAGATWTCAGEIRIPSSLSAGGYYLIAYADDRGQVNESNEANDWLAATTGLITLH